MQLEGAGEKFIKLCKTTSISGGAHLGTVPTYPTQTININAGLVPTNGWIDMLSFWDDSAILSEDDVASLFGGELTYAELSI